MSVLGGCPSYGVSVLRGFTVCGKNREYGKNRKIFKSSNKGNIKKYQIHISTNFHEEIMIFDEIRGHLLILLFYRLRSKGSTIPGRGSLNIPFRGMMQFCITLHFSTTTKATMVKLGYSMHLNKMHWNALR